VTETKLVSKRKSIARYVDGAQSHVGHHYDPTKGPLKNALIEIEASVFGGSPVKISVVSFPGGISVPGWHQNCCRRHASYARAVESQKRQLRKASFSKLFKSGRTFVTILTSMLLIKREGRGDSFVTCWHVTNESPRPSL